MFSKIQLYINSIPYVFKKIPFKLKKTKEKSIMSKITKTYVISCIIPNSKIIEPFYKTIMKYKETVPNCEFILYSTQLRMKESLIHNETSLEYLWEDDKELNTNLKIIDLPLAHTAIDPVLGITHHKGCVIVPAPRIRWKTLPSQHKNASLPRAIYSTGTICEATNYKRTKQQAKAKNLHVTNGVGALIVEIIDNKYFQCRYIKWDAENECFYDMPHNDRVVKFTPKSTHFEHLEVLSTGDLHQDHMDMDMWKWTDSIVKKMKPRYVYFHDTYDGSAYYVNHHINNAMIKRENVNMSIKEELDNYTEFFEDKVIRPKHWQNVVKRKVKSNHDEFIDRFLEDESRLYNLSKSLCNSIIAQEENKFNIVQETLETFYELIGYAKKYKDPLKEYCIKRSKLMNKLEWLSRDSNCVHFGVQFGDHGDKGVNGSRGSAAQFGRANAGATCTGHTHSPEITPEGNHVNGTSSILNPDYCDPSGYSSWMQSHTAMYPNGMMTMVCYINI